MKSTASPAVSRMDRLIHERVHDPYKSRHKPPEPSYCPECKAIFHQGRWQWAESRPAAARPVTCQACLRIRDDYPAGLVTIEGGFVAAHRDEILSLVTRQELDEKTQHPLHRIMRIVENPAAISIQTTDVHLPRRIGEAVRRAYKGELELRYAEDGCFLRARWSREA